MNYGELKQAILDDTHRPDLTTHIERFVRECEGMIRRYLTAYELSTTITDADRVSEGIFSTPARVLVVRSIHLQGRQGDDLVRVSPGQIRRLSASSDVLQYAQYGNDRFEFRGVPGTTDVFDISYFGTPAPFTTDTDENDLLTDHETLYLAGSKVFLYNHTQDLELAASQGQLFDNIIEDLNEQVARKIGGAQIAPTYNFAGGSSY